MRTNLCLSRSGRFAVRVGLLVGFLMLASAARGAEAKPAGTLNINAWEFDRGNARVSENPGQYGDYRDKHPELMLTAGDKTAWSVEYDIDFPVEATYTLRVRYASAGVYPLDVLIDNKLVGKSCGKKTCNPPPYMDRHPNVYKGLPERTWDKHGAEWENSCQIKITAGKHTLKFARNGTPANLLEIRLESPVAFPKGWRQSKRKWDLNRVPVRYRNAFLPADAVNVEALRLAIEDNINAFGPRYPKGPQYLKELADLEKRQIAGRETGTPEGMQELHEALAAFRSRAMLAHPALKIDKLLFGTQVFRTMSTYTGQKLSMKSKPGGNICVLSPVSPDGKVTELVPELSGGSFGRFNLSFDATKIAFCYGKVGGHFRIYEIDIDPKTGRRAGGKSLRQLTFGSKLEAETMKRYAGTHCAEGFEDMDPCYLPNGKIMFASTRSQRSVLCNPTTVTTLHVMDSDGKNMVCISRGQVNELDPRVLDDGRVVYMRWEYVDKGFGNVQSLWAIRPDGSGSDHVYKNSIVRPGAMLNASSIPNSRKLVAIGAGHHGGLCGPVVLLDTRKNRRNADAMENITPEISYPGLYNMTRGKGEFQEPYPLSEKLFLVSHRPGGFKYAKGEGFGIYALDRWGNRAELYRDPDLSCVLPTPLKPRRMPVNITPVDMPTEKKDQKLATMFLLDVYQGLDGIERGRVKYIRVMEAMNLGWYDTWRAQVQGDNGNYQQISAVSNGGDVARKYIHGLARVHPDGSAFFTVPANKNIYFQALDENYMELQRMRTFLNLLPGENRSCIGCHELRRKAPGLKKNALPQALVRGVEALYPLPGDTGPRAVHYPLDIQPILNRRCISCHSGAVPKGGLALTDEPTKFFTRSYEGLTYHAKLQKKALVSFLYTSTFGSAHVPIEPPLTFGSHRSKMVEQIRKAPCESKLTREEFIKIVTWIDANAPFYGTHKGRKNIKWKDHPDFRPLPLAKNQAKDIEGRNQKK
jgi:hypothetical protein